MKPARTFITLSVAIVAGLPSIPAADPPKPAVTVTQELLNSIHVTPQLILDPFPAYAQKYLPFAMAASIESTRGGRLWTCWAGGQDGPNAYLLASFSDDEGKSWRDPVFVIDPQAHGLKMGTRLGAFWCDPRGRLWLFFHQSVGMFDGSCSNWYVRCDDPDAENPVWTEPVYFGFGASLNKPVVRRNGEWILPVLLWERWHVDKPFADCYRELDAVRGANVFVSDDEGGHWRFRGGTIFTDSCFNERGKVSYPDIAQAPNGVIYVHYDRDRNGAAEILFARFREEDVQAGKLVSEGAALKNLVKSRQHGMNRGGADAAKSPTKSP